MAGIGDTIKCKVCKKEIRKRSPRQIYCQKCRYKAYADSSKRWGKTNREYRNMKKRDWYDTNRQHVRDYNREYQRKRRARQAEESSG
jgi:hypothetical protein